jgi:DnaJ homolog subfamily C member 16
MLANFIMYFVFRFVDSKDLNTEKLRQRYSVELGLDSVMLFREDWKRPTATVSMVDIPMTTLQEIVSSNQFLTLPRLSSQVNNDHVITRLILMHIYMKTILESVCPAEWQGGRRRLCAVLVTRHGDQHDGARAALRHYIRTVQFPSDRVRFAHVYMDVQKQFVESLAAAGKN